MAETIYVGRGLAPGSHVVAVISEQGALVIAQEGRTPVSITLARAEAVELARALGERFAHALAARLIEQIDATDPAGSEDPASAEAGAVPNASWAPASAQVTAKGTGRLELHGMPPDARPDDGGLVASTVRGGVEFTRYRGDTWVCLTCGAVVVDQGLHARWHAAAIPGDALAATAAAVWP